jgi:predicted DNA-binding transcriptional regulator AlpA
MVGEVDTSKDTSTEETVKKVLLETVIPKLTELQNALSQDALSQEGKTPLPSPASQDMLLLLVNDREAGRLCGIGRSSWRKLHSTGKTPLPVHLGRRVLWRVAELVAWSNNGCPPRHKWEWPAAASHATASHAAASHAAGDNSLLLLGRRAKA